MNSENQTPKRWKVVAGKKSDELFIESANRDGGRICRLWNGRSDRESHANLIACAPEMHDGLTLAFTRIDNIMSGMEPGTPLWKDLQKVLFGIHDALPPKPEKEE